MLTIRKILFPTDFSNASTAALGHAVMLAESFSAELTLFHVAVDEKHLQQAHFPELEKAGDELEEMIEEQLAEMTGAARPRRLAVKRVVRRNPEPVKEIVAYCASEDFDLLVMGTRGRTGMVHLLMGSITEDLVRAAPCPVLTVREHMEKDEVSPYLKILVPVDFSPHAEKALKYGIALAMNFEASLAVFHVLDVPVQPAHYDFDESMLLENRPNIEGLTQDAMHELVKKLSPQKIDYTVTCAIGRAYAEIVEHAVKSDSDLIVLGTHGLSALEKFFLGSTAAKVVRHAPCPVLTVKEMEKDFV